MIDDNMICKRQIHAAVKITDNTESENMKMNHTQINKISKISEFAE